MAGGVKRTGTGVSSTGAGGTGFDLSTGIQRVMDNPDVGSIPTSKNIAPSEYVPENSLDVLFGGSNLGKQIDRMLAPSIHDRTLLQAEVFPRQLLSGLLLLINKDKDSEDEEERKRRKELEELYRELRNNRKLFKMLSGLLIAG